MKLHLSPARHRPPRALPTHNREGSWDRGQVMRVAVLHTGALHESTIGYAQKGVCAARRLAYEWTSGDLVSVAVFWAPKPHGFQSGCARFDSVRVLQWNASTASSATTAGHQREAWRALRVAIDAALDLRANWMFRVRFDAHVSAWNVPLPADALWEPDCIYGFKQSWGCGLPTTLCSSRPARAACSSIGDYRICSTSGDSPTPRGWPGCDSAGSAWTSGCSSPSAPCSARTKARSACAGGRRRRLCAPAPTEARRNRHATTTHPYGSTSGRSMRHGTPMPRRHSRGWRDEVSTRAEAIARVAKAARQ